MKFLVTFVDSLVLFPPTVEEHKALVFLAQSLVIFLIIPE